MFRQLCNLIDKFLFPKRIVKGLSCNDGIWWFIPALVNALAGAAGAIGSGIGAAAGAIGSGIGSAAGAIGGAASSAIGGLGSLLGIGAEGAGTGLVGAGSQAGYAATLANMAGGAGLTAGTGTVAGSAAASASAIGSQAAGLGIGAKAVEGGLMKGIGSTLSKEMLGYDPEASMKENVSNMVVKQAEGSTNQKSQPPTVNIDNSYSGKAPNVVDSSKTPTGGDLQQLPPEVLMQVLQMMKQKQAQAQNTTAPIANNFPGGYY